MNAELGDVAEAVGRPVARRPDGVDDVLAVRPDLHQPGGEERLRPHRRPVPRDSGVVVERRPGSGERGSRFARQAARSSSGVIARDGPSVTSSADVTVGGATARSSRRRRPRVDDRQRSGAVEVGQVADLVGDVPAGARRGEVPLLRRAATPRSSSSALLFGDQVVEYFANVHLQVYPIGARSRLGASARSHYGDAA